LTNSEEATRAKTEEEAWAKAEEEARIRAEESARVMAEDEIDSFQELGKERLESAPRWLRARVIADHAA